ncbi:MAG TPA: methyltransferase domain-containing protein [Stellaceae bacterium]|jgi:SAM-dependent methyltransferase|nr:methyltransferase domain-containing protein [Stellaceae bacterium]
MVDDLPELPAHAFEKDDASPDPLFYEQPRFVTHIDDRAIAAVTALYRDLFPAGGTVLDLMGSWVSHLPPDIAYAEVIGHGMNEAELKANPRYTRWFVQDLNAEPKLPLADASIDAAAICVSVQYLQHPVAVFRELKRVLKPGGALAITFSNRCFPTKAVAIWLGLAVGQHQRLVGLYLERAGFASVDPRVLIPPGLDQDPLWAVIGRA